MELERKHVILTGAGGGIGRCLTGQLAAQDCRLLLVDRELHGLETLRSELNRDDQDCRLLAADITTAAGRQEIISTATHHFEKIDLLINLAGTMHFGSFKAEDEHTTELLFAVNVLAPMQLSRAVLPLMPPGSRIVNIGSIFGSIAFAYFTSYSATKFALRGFSEALRRELTDSGIGVTYIAPRATRTPFNNQAVYDMSDRVKMNFDSPEHVAAQIVSAIRADAKEKYLGRPESLFVRLNSLLPRLVDRALRKQNRMTRDFALKTHSASE